MVAPVCCLENRKGSFMVSRQLLLSNSAVGAWRVSCLPAGPSSRHSTGLGGYFLNLPALWYFPTCEFFSRSFCYYIPKALVVGKNALSLSPVCAFFLDWLACSASFFCHKLTFPGRATHLQIRSFYPARPPSFQRFSADLHTSHLIWEKELILASVGL